MTEHVHTARPDGQASMTEDTSDGFHTFRELYDHRMALTLAFFRALDNDVELRTGDMPWRSRLHHDGQRPYDGGWFVVGVTLQGPGQITYHYEDRHWEAFDLPGMRTLDRAPAWDGHTPGEVVNRLTAWALRDD